MQELDTPLLDRVIEDRFQGYFQYVDLRDTEPLNVDWKGRGNQDNPENNEQSWNYQSGSSRHNST